MTRVQPVHSGEVLRHDFMAPLGLSSTALARAIGVTPARINEIVRGRRGITAGTALRLAKCFGTEAQSWMNLQTQYELALAEAAASGNLRTIRPNRSDDPVTAREREPGQPARDVLSGRNLCCSGAAWCYRYGLSEDTPYRRDCMRRACSIMTPALAIGMALILGLPAGAAAQSAVAESSGAAPTADWTVPRTPWGAPDLQGVWDYRTMTPLERPRELAGKVTLTAAEKLSPAQQN